MEQTATVPLLRALLRAGRSVMLETNGVHDLARVPRAVKRIVDVKGPSSRRQKAGFLANLRRLRAADEVKFVIADRRDYRFAKDVLRRFRIRGKQVLLSPLAGRLTARRLAGWILKDRLDVRLQVQLHKILWRAGARGR